MKRPLNILFISPTVACYIGGTETVVGQLSQRLKDRVQLTLLSGVPGEGRKGLINADGFELLTLPFIGRDSKLNHVLSKLLMSSPFKIESYSFFRQLAKSGIDLSRYDCIVTFYEADAYLLSKRYPFMRGRFRHFLPGVSVRGFFKHVPATDVYFFGYRAAEKVKRKWRLTIPSLPLGVDSAFFPNARPTYPAGTKRLIYIGRLDGSKHVDWLVDFFADSGFAHKGYQLDIVGDGPLMDGLLAKYGQSTGIVFHGRKPQEDIVGILRQAFLLLHPTDLESFGLTILEAMAAGVPVITHELDSIKIWAQHHPCYAAHLDRSAWTNAISKFEDPSYWEQISATGIEHAKSFTWERVAEQVLNLMSPHAETESAKTTVAQ